MAVTVSFDVDMGRGATFNHGTARGAGVVFGSLDIPTYAGGGVTCSIDALRNQQAVLIQDQNGRFFSYNHTSSLLKIYGYGTSTNTFEIASDTDAASFSTAYFVAFGFD